MPRKSNVLVEQGQVASNPASPGSGYSVLFPKTDGKWYLKNSDGSVYEINTGYKAVVTLTDAATVTWNFALGYNSKLTLGGNRTLAISNAQAGDYGTLVVTQDGTGSRTLALPSGSKVVSTGAGVIALSTVAGSIDILTFYYDGTNYFWNVGKNYT